MESGGEPEPELDLSLNGVGLHLYHHNTTSPRQLRLRVDIDPSFGYKRLRLTGDELLKPPPTIWKLKELEFLDMSPGLDCESCFTFHLERLSPDVSNLVNLRILCLDTNKLTSLPSEVGRLVNLERLIVSNNLITDLPQSLGSLDKLCSLHLANNDLEEIPKVVYLLTNLQFLDISDNKLTCVAPEIGQLINLESLLLMCNLLQSIPDTIGDCHRLKTLWLAMNRLTELPRSIGKLFDLDWGTTSPTANLEGNPLKDPPLEICKKGPLVIEEYFRNKEMMIMIMSRNDTPRSIAQGSAVVLEETMPLRSSSKDSNKHDKPRSGKQGSFLPEATSNKVRPPSTTSNDGKESAARGASRRSVKKNAWMTSPDHGGERVSQSHEHLREKESPHESLPASRADLNSRTTNVIKDSPSPSYNAIFSPVAPSASQSQPQSASRRRSPQSVATKKPRQESGKRLDSSNSLPVLKPVEVNGSGDRVTPPEGFVIKGLLDERSPSRYSDYVRARAWDRWEQVTRSLPPSDAEDSGSRTPSSSEDLFTSANSYYIKSMINSSTPRYDFSFNNTRDIQVLRLHESPRADKEKENSFSLFAAKIPKAPSKPKSGAKSAPSVKSKSARNLNGKINGMQNGNDVTDAIGGQDAIELDFDADDDLNVDEAITFTADDTESRHESRLSRQSRADDDEPSRSGSHKSRGSADERNSTNIQNDTKKIELPLIMVNSKQNSPNPQIPTPKPEDVNTQTKPTRGSKSAPATPYSRRRGYVVEKRRMMARKKPIKRKISGKLYRAKKSAGQATGATLGLTVDERPDTVLTFCIHDDDVSDDHNDEIDDTTEDHHGHDDENPKGNDTHPINPESQMKNKLVRVTRSRQSPDENNTKSAPGRLPTIPLVESSKIVSKPKRGTLYPSKRTKSVPDNLPDVEIAPKVSPRKPSKSTARKPGSSLSKSGPKSGPGSPTKMVLVAPPKVYP
ncbi:uncharacterized protein [Amphiura filiformis]|uniref:uncharacterized protein n=1 Tax=Amphiura filiformis TaxID=82378 RepID=UPI003B214262